MRLIDADALKSEMIPDLANTMLMQEMNKGDMARRVLYKIDDAPTIDTVKRGEWVEIQYGVLVCSECKKQSLKFNYDKGNIPTNYCPHCGARMVEGREWRSN